MKSNCAFLNVRVSKCDYTKMKSVANFLIVEKNSLNVSLIFSYLRVYIRAVYSSGKTDFPKKAVT